MIDQQILASDLHAAGELPVAWDAAFRAVDRARFIPGRIWVEEDGRDVAINYATEPERWKRAVYSDRVIVTQFDDGTTAWPDTGFRPTSSCSMPSAVLGMLDALDVHQGDRVLEIGTGTGYNAALLTQHLGNDHVTTMEIDPVLTNQARSAFAGSGHKPTVVCGDGTAGHPPGAPYDRIIVSAAVKLGRVPYAWVKQTKPGGTIIAPVKTDFAAGPLVTFSVGADGTAIGRVVPMRVQFMELHSHRSPRVDWGGFRWDDTSADLTHTDIVPWTTLGNESPQWAVAVSVPNCRYELWKTTAERNHGVAWLGDPLSGSWASVIPGDDEDQYDVRQYGPRRLWNEVSATYQWWLDQGRPSVDRWRFTISQEGQTASVVA